MIHFKHCLIATTFGHMKCVYGLSFPLPALELKVDMNLFLVCLHLSFSLRQLAGKLFVE